MITNLIPAVILSFAVSVTQATLPLQSTGCGHAVDGVQICLTTSGSNLQLAFGNVGSKDVTLNLGVMMANGKIQLSDRIAMKCTDAQGETRLFQPFGTSIKDGASVRSFQCNSTSSRTVATPQRACIRGLDVSIHPVNPKMMSRFEEINKQYMEIFWKNS